MNTFITSFLLLAAILFSNILACRVQTENQTIPFVFHEITENYTSGTQLPGNLQIHRNSNERVFIKTFKTANNVADEFIKADFNETCGCIEFYLRTNKTLREYRYETWSPSLEYEFQFFCSLSDDAQIYTYMLGIKDENLYSPEFTESRYEGELMYSRLNGYKIQYKNPIKVVDVDFNKAHANVTLSCQGYSCAYFDFQPRYEKIDKGHHFQIGVTPKNLQELSSIWENGKVLTVHLDASDGLHECTKTAQVDFTVFAEEGETPISGNGGSSYLSLMITIGVGVFIVLSCSGTVAYLAMRSRKTKNLLRQLTEAEIREFLEGNASFATSERTRSVDVNTPIMALPYNRSFEIRRDKLRIDETTILGTGAFGIVWKGCVLYSNGESITVAVKTVKRNVGILYFKALLSEIKIMAYIGKHPNIVSLVGACTHNIRKREVYIAVQYCANGSFHNYLKCRRERFSNMVVDGILQPTNSAMHSYAYSNQGCFSKTISTMDLLKWSTQIANGLQYLESLGVIHGDLATRNVLLDSERICKIGDFGLSRRLIDYSNYYYTKTSQAPLPWKWMAPESLKDLRFSKKSDIWSFGIVLWEVFTLGQTPYPGLNWDEGFVERLEKGMRPIKPAFASNSIYNIMVDCWNIEPHDRPAVLDIKRTLENITSSALRQKNDMGYMRFHGEQSILRMITEDEQGYLEPQDPFRKNYIEA